MGCQAPRCNRPLDGARARRYPAGMQLVVNGEAREFDPAPSSVSALLVLLALPGQRVAVELNGSVVPKREHDARELAPGDIVEIVTLVGGG